MAAQAVEASTPVDRPTPAADPTPEPTPEPPRYGLVPEAVRIQEATITVSDGDGTTSTVAARARVRIEAREGGAVVRYDLPEIDEIDIKGVTWSGAKSELVAGVSAFAWAVDPLGAHDVDATQALPAYQAQQLAFQRAAQHLAPYAPEARAIRLLEYLLQVPRLPKAIPEQGMELVYSEETSWGSGGVRLPLLETHIWNHASSEDGLEYWTVERTATGAGAHEGWGQTTLERTERGAVTLESKTHLPVAFELHIEERLVSDHETRSFTTDIKSIWKTE